MKQTSLEALRANLLSENLEEQIPALDQACKLVEDIITIAVQMLEKGPERYLVAERLPRLGPTVVEPLQSLLLRSSNSEVKVLASLVLLRLGSEIGMDVLMHALSVDRNYPVLIAEHLAARKVCESADRMISRLRTAEPDEIDLIVGFLRALAELRAEIPADLMSRFTQPSMPWQVRRVSEEISKQSSGG